MKLSIEIAKTSMCGQSLVTMRKPDDKHLPSLQQTMPTDVAEYIKQLVEKDQRLAKVGELFGLE